MARIQLRWWFHFLFVSTSTWKLQQIKQLHLPDKIHWAKINLRKNETTLFSSSQISYNVLGIVSWGQRTLSRRFSEHSITYKLICKKVFITQFKITKMKLQLLLNTGNVMQCTANANACNPNLILKVYFWWVCTIQNLQFYVVLLKRLKKESITKHNCNLAKRLVYILNKKSCCRINA